MNSEIPFPVLRVSVLVLHGVSLFQLSSRAPAHEPRCSMRHQTPFLRLAGVGIHSNLPSWGHLVTPVPAVGRLEQEACRPPWCVQSGASGDALDCAAGLHSTGGGAIAFTPPVSLVGLA